MMCYLILKVINGPIKISTAYLSFDVDSGVRWLNIHVYQGSVHVSVRGVSGGPGQFIQRDTGTVVLISQVC